MNLVKIIVVFYTILILFIVKQGTWSLVDEPQFLLEDNYWAGIQLIKCGRASLLHGLFPKIICMITKNNTRIVYFYVSIIFLMTTYIVYNEFKEKQKINLLLFVFLILFLLSPGIVTIFSSVLFEEKLLIIYFLLLGIFIHRYYNVETNTMKTKIILVLLAFLINFSKEGGILSLFIIGILMVVKNTIEKRSGNYFIEKLFIIVPILTILFWRIVILDHTTMVYSNPNMSIAGYYEYSLTAIKFIVSDPVIFLLLIPMLGIRLKKILQTKSITVADIMAYGGLGTLGVILITQTHHASYYLVPLYGMMLWFFYQEKQFFKKPIMKVLVGITVVCMIKNIPDGINHFLSSRYERIIHTEIKKLVEYEQVFCEGLLSMTVLNNRYEKPHVFPKGSLLVQSPSLNAHKLVRSKTEIITAAQPSVVLYEQEVPQIKQFLEFKTLFGFQPAERKLIYRVVRFI
jgi:hypothetical protein